MITFIGMGSRSSGQVRGVQIAPEVGGNFFNVDSNTFLGEIGFHKTVVFVRRFLPDLAARLKSQGCTVGYDLIDRPVADVHKFYSKSDSKPEVDWESYKKLSVDFMIVNNTLTKECLQQGSSCPPVKVIPHHSCNFEEYVKPVTKKVKTVGYVGLPDQICNSEEISSWLSQKGVDFLSINPKDRISVLEAHKNIDIGLVFLQNKGYYKEVMRYKPGQKLLNFQSMGIPSVVCGYESFREFGGEAFLEVENLSDVYEKLEHLLKDFDERERLSLAGIKNSKKYTVKKIARLYK